MKLKLLLLAFAAIGSFMTTPAGAQAYAVKNARIVTVSGETLNNGTVVVRDGLIVAVGTGVSIPADATVFDGTGTTVYPGFIDALTSLGVASAPARPTGRSSGASGDADDSNSNFPAGLRPEDMIVAELKAGEDQFEKNRAAGFTTALTTGRTGIFSGRSAVINLAGDTVSAMIVDPDLAQHFSFVTVGRGSYPASLLGTFSAFRQMLYDAQRLRELQVMYASDPKGMRRPESDRSLESLFGVVSGDVPVVFNANRETEILRALNLAKEFDLKAIIAGGQEAWKVADRLKEQNVPVLLSLNFPKRTAASSPDADNESLDLLRFRAETPKGPSILQKAGVKFAFQSGQMTNLTDFFANAGKAVESGLSREAAIRAMTLGSAEILGLDKTLGSIESGKIANITVVKGDVFSKDRIITHVFVDGKLFEPKQPEKKPAGQQPGGTTPSAIMQVGGNYSVVIQVPGQSMNGTLVLQQQGSTVTGSFQTDIGTTPVNNGKVTAEGFTFDGTVDFAGSTINIIVSGVVRGDDISGTIDTPQGGVSFAGTRNP